MRVEKLLIVKKFSVDFIDRRINKKLNPCIFSNAVAQWPALQNWNMAFFKERYGNLDVTINYNLPDDIPPYLHKAEAYTKQMQLADFFDAMPKESRGCYLAQSEINVFPGLENDFNFQELIPPKDHLDKIYNYIWVGKNTRSGLHYDFEDNFLVQVFGMKKVFLVAPEHAQFVYPLPENFLKSQVNPMNPDFKKYPKFKNATLFEGEISAGDVLFIPRGWYHYIYSPQESISLNCWYGASLSPKELFVSFYRSGIKIWLSFLRDFFWYGMFARQAKERLYCSPPIGRLAFDLMMSKIKNVF